MEALKIEGMKRVDACWIPLREMIPDPYDDIENTEDDVFHWELSNAVNDVLASLTNRERRVLQLRFGLDDDRPRSLEEVGKELGVSRERIRQIEAKALRKLQHPIRAKRLIPFFHIDSWVYSPRRELPPTYWDQREIDTEKAQRLAQRKAEQERQRVERERQRIESDAIKQKMEAEYEEGRKAAAAIRNQATLDELRRRVRMHFTPIVAGTYVRVAHASVERRLISGMDGYVLSRSGEMVDLRLHGYDVLSVPVWRLEPVLDEDKTS